MTALVDCVPRALPQDAPSAERTTTESAGAIWLCAQGTPAERAPAGCIRARWALTSALLPALAPTPEPNTVVRNGARRAGRVGHLRAEVGAKGRLRAIGQLRTEGRHAAPKRARGQFAAAIGPSRRGSACRACPWVWRPPRVRRGSFRARSRRMRTTA
jgi:hypothetical protein